MRPVLASGGLRGSQQGQRLRRVEARQGKGQDLDAQGKVEQGTHALEKGASVSHLAKVDKRGFDEKTLNLQQIMALDERLQTLYRQVTPAKHEVEPAEPGRRENYVAHGRLLAGNGHLRERLQRKTQIAERQGHS